MVTTLKERARGCLAGLAVGDALGSPTEGKTPQQISALWGRVTDFINPEQTGSDDTEYALFNAKLLLEKQEELTSAEIADAWRKYLVKADNRYKGAGFSEIIAISNLKNGLNPPFSGQHLHSWSDGLAMRVAPFGIAAAGNPELASRMTEADGQVSHAGEGIFSGQAVAAAIASAMNGNSLDEIFNAALKAVPAESWTSNAIKEGIRIGKNSPDVWASLEPLHAAIAASKYFWTDVAPEAVGLAFGLIAASNGEFKDAVTGAVNIGRDTDTIAAIAGAVCGAHKGIKSIPEKWISRIMVLKGICISTVKEMDILDTADKLFLLAEKWSGK